jgi:hypothetical protein
MACTKPRTFAHGKYVSLGGIVHILWVVTNRDPFVGRHACDGSGCRLRYGTDARFGILGPKINHFELANIDETELLE